MAGGGSITPVVGVGIPFFSGLGYLQQAIRSVIDQTDPHWRVVVIDDSPDGMARGLVELADEPRLEYRRNVTTIGMVANFDRCFDVLGDELGCDIVIILHGDDALEAGFVERVRTLHDSYPGVAAVATNAFVVSETGAPTSSLVDRVKQELWPKTSPFELCGDRGLARLLTGQFWYCPAMSFRMALLPVQRWTGQWAQTMDTAFFGRLLLDGRSILLVNEPLYRYRRHANAATAINSRSRARFREEAEVSRLLGSAARQQGWHRSAVSASLRLTHRAHCLLVGISDVGSRRFQGSREMFALAVGKWSLPRAAEGAAPGQ